MARQLLLASNNAKKLNELRSLLQPLGVDLLGQGELAIPEADEPFATFVENALAKARHASRLSGLPALADDSGLCVDALNGLPGVRSGRFARDAGRGEGDSANNSHLLERMQGVSSRNGRFVCVLVAVRSSEDPEPLMAVGSWPLVVLEKPMGDGGFGYDPVVQAQGAEGSVATLPAAIKNAQSHRARAMQQMMLQLQQQWGWQ